MQTSVQGDLARVWKHWRWIWMDPHIWTHSCSRLGIQFPHCISCQAWSSSSVLIMLLHFSSASMHFPTGISFINSLVYSVCLFSLTPSFSTLFRVFFLKLSNFFSFYFLNFLTHTFRSQNKINIYIYIRNKDTILTGGRQQNPFLLSFSGAILGPLLSISTLLLLVLSFKAPSPLHCGPNPL